MSEIDHIVDKNHNKNKNKFNKKSRSNSKKAFGKKFHMKKKEKRYDDVSTLEKRIAKETPPNNIYYYK